MTKLKKPKEPKFFLEKPPKKIGGFGYIDTAAIKTLQDLLDQMPEGVDYKNIKLSLYCDDGPVDININFPAQENPAYKKQKDSYDKKKATHKVLYDKWKEDMKEFEINKKKQELEKLKDKVAKLEKENGKK